MNPPVLSMWTVDFRSATVAERQPHSVSAHLAPATLTGALRDLGASEALVLSTCNRVLWLTVGGQPRAASTGHRFAGREAIRHLCRVVAGLESMVLGEPQILGQIKDAWELSRSAGASGPHIEYLMPRVIGLAKAVRHESGLGKGAVSVAHVGVQQGLGAWRGDGSPVALIVGAGKMASIAVRQLRASGVKAIHVANRTYESAVRLGESSGACPVAYAEIHRLIRETASIVVCACAAPHTIVGPEHLTPGRDLVLVDLAVPGNVDPAAALVPGVTVLGLDEIAAGVAKGLERREAAAAAAAAALDARLPRLIDRYENRHRHVGLQDAQLRWDAIRRTELNRIRPALAASEREWGLIEALAWRLTRKITHDTVFASLGSGRASQ
ncbi:MAG: hypothetical protein R2729_18240 [Bryobacteraceae bacterium]